ncbi:MAG: riboflavin synthase [Spirochaetes bacterium]|nr:riboflavin synthase [Spirochaetota bacterium]
MFTGLIEEIGTVKSIKGSGGGVHITVKADKVIEGTKTGDSITVDGACQTVTDIGTDGFTVFASRVTCDVTTLGSMKSGSRVNLERAISPSSRFGGHIVQGHVDGTGIIKNISKDQNGTTVEISAHKDILRYIVAKGSVTVDGISLTVVSLTESGFTLYLIPETMKNTTLPEKGRGSVVNIEVDILAKYVERMLGAGVGADSRDENLKRKLFEEGFI